MKKTVICCDGCGCEISNPSQYNHYRMPAYKRYDSMEGRPLDKEYITQVDVDLCDKCARKATNVEDTSCMGLSIRIDDVKHDGI